MSEVKEFGIGALLSLSTGRLCSKFSEVHELIEHLAGGPVWTHQIPAAAEELGTDLLRQHPWLIKLKPPEPFDTEAKVNLWVGQQSAEHGRTHEVTAMEGGWGRDPVADLVDMVGPDRVIPVIVGDGGPS